MAQTRSRANAYFRFETFECMREMSAFVIIHLDITCAWTVGAVANSVNEGLKNCVEAHFSTMAELNPQFDVSLRHLQNLNEEQCHQVEGIYGSIVSASLKRLRSSLPRTCKRVNVEKGIRKTSKVGSIKAGASVSFRSIWSTFVPTTTQSFQYSAVVASSKTAKAATSESARLRAISVGDVVVLKNEDHLTEKWYVFVAHLISDENNPSLVGIGRWVFNQEDVNALDTSIKLAKREVIVSNYAVEIHSCNILDVVDMVHEAFDNPKDEDSVFCRRFLDVYEETIHAVVLPRSVYNEKPHPELGSMLLALQSKALMHAGLVSVFYLKVCANE
jgi:hypothetical protein